MKRKLVLMIGTFLTLLLAFGTYQLFVPGIAGMDPTNIHYRTPNFGAMDPDGARVGKTRNVSFYDRREDGQLRGVYKVDSWTKQDDGSYLLEHPSAVIYHSDGSRTYMSAEMGTLRAEQVEDGFNVRNGRMTGDVEVFFDRSRELQREHPRERMFNNWEKYYAEVLRLKCRDVAFDRDVLEIQTDHEFNLWSRQLDLSGKGISIRWNERPRELRRLRIEQGDVMIVKELPEQVDMIQLPTPKEDSPQSQPSETARRRVPDVLATVPGEALAQTDDDVDWGLPGESDSGSAPSSVKTTPADEKSALSQDDTAETVVTPPTSQPATPKAPSEARRTPTAEIVTGVDAPKTIVIEEKDREGRNVFQATFGRHVRVHSEQGRKLQGADTLTMTFEWDRKWSGSGEEPSELDQTVEDDSNRSRAAQTGTSAADESPSSAESVDPVAAKDGQDETPSGGDRMEIYWEGPLEIVPVGYEPDPSRKRFVIEGRGEKVVLSDPTTRLECASFTFENPRQEAIFHASEDKPIRLITSNAEEILCQDELRFSREDGQGRLTGKGTLTRYTSEGGQSAMQGLREEDMTPGAVLDQIYWSDHVEIEFEEKPYVDEKGQTRNRQVLRQSDFYGDVQLVRRISAEGDAGKEDRFDYIKCAQLHITMADTQDGRTYPAKAVADGKVIARQENSLIGADHVDVKFRPQGHQGSAPAPAERSSGMSDVTGGANFEAEHLTARGNVRIKDESDTGEEPRYVVAEVVEADLAKRTAQLTGTSAKPALIKQGNNSITGEVIDFDQDAEQAVVQGGGKLEFFSKQDLSGNALAKPRYVRIDWTEGMDYGGVDAVAVFRGDVKLLSGDDSMKCREMKLYFDKVLPEDGAAEDAAPAEMDSRLGLGVDRYSRRKIRRIEATGGVGEETLVAMQSIRRNVANPNWLERRLDIRGETVVYDAQTGRADVTGAGRFTAEDYRPPEKGDSKSKDEGMGSALERPSQTLLMWKDSLSLSQNDRHVRCRGQVEMFHRSGKEIKKLKGLQTIPLGTLDDGRSAKLRCDALDAWFAEPEEQPAEQKAPGADLLDAGPQLGPLQRFFAVGDVTMADGPMMLDGQQVIYDGKQKVVTVMGYRPDAQVRTNATVTRTDPQTNAVQTWQKPIIRWFQSDPDTGQRERIEVEKLSGGGGA